MMTKLYMWLAGAAALIIGIFSVHAKGKASGKAEIKAEVKEESAERMIEDVELKRKVTEDVQEHIADADFDERVDSL